MDNKRAAHREVLSFARFSSQDLYLTIKTTQNHPTQETS